MRGKGFKPPDFGETKESPVLTLLVCRAWALWRLTQSEWHKADPAGRREFQKEEAELLKDIQDIQAPPPSLMGNDAADTQLRTWVPHLAARVHPGAHG